MVQNPGKTPGIILDNRFIIQDNFFVEGGAGAGGEARGGGVRGGGAARRQDSGAAAGQPTRMPTMPCGSGSQSSPARTSSTRRSTRATSRVY